MLFRPRVVRRRSRIILRPLLWTLLAVFLIDAWLILRSRGRTVRSPVAAPGIARDALASAEPPANTSVFIVSVHRNTEPILRDSWVDSVVRLVDHLGADNVYVSAIESGSQDNTKEALLGLKALLSARGVAHTIELGATVWQQLEELNAWPAPDAPPAKRRGWIWHADEGHLALRRIPYLARVRNQAMAPLLAAARGPQPRYFDRVLWINDVAFDVSVPLSPLVFFAAPPSNPASRRPPTFSPSSTPAAATTRPRAPWTSKPTPTTTTRLRCAMSTATRLSPPIGRGCAPPGAAPTSAPDAPCAFSRAGTE